MSKRNQLTASFAWLNIGLLCGQCHFMLHCENSKNDIPVEYRARCGNAKCVNFGKLFRVGIESSIPLYEITDKIVSEEL